MQGRLETELDLPESLDVASGPHSRMVCLLPTSPSFQDGELYSTFGMVIGARPGVVTVHDGLRRVQQDPPQRILIHSDQLVEPAVANILVLVDEFEGYISSIECLLNSKYGYALHVWAGDTWLDVPPNAPVREVASAVVAHLQACRSLHDWELGGMQRRRMRRVRHEVIDRKMRFVRSSIAAAFADAIDADEAAGFHADLAGLERRATTGMRV